MPNILDSVLRSVKNALRDQGQAMVDSARESVLPWMTVALQNVVLAQAQVPPGRVCGVVQAIPGAYNHVACGKPATNLCTICHRVRCLEHSFLHASGETICIYCALELAAWKRDGVPPTKNAPPHAEAQGQAQGQGPHHHHAHHHQSPPPGGGPSGHAAGHADEMRRRAVAERCAKNLQELGFDPSITKSAAQAVMRKRLAKMHPDLAPEGPRRRASEERFSHINGLWQYVLQHHEWPPEREKPAGRRRPPQDRRVTP